MSSEQRRRWSCLEFRCCVCVVDGGLCACACCSGACIVQCVLVCAVWIARPWGSVVCAGGAEHKIARWLDSSSRPRAVLTEGSGAWAADPGVQFEPAAVGAQARFKIEACGLSSLEVEKKRATGCKTPVARPCHSERAVRPRGISGIGCEAIVQLDPTELLPGDT